MIQHYLPNRQILLAVGRTLLTAQSRWAYVALAFINVMVIGGGGAFKGAKLEDFIQFAAGALALNLTFFWLWFALRLMALNHSTAARLVPHYTRRLRVTLLWLWALNIFTIGIIGLLDGALSQRNDPLNQPDGLVWIELLQGAVAIGFPLFFLIAPFRWPVRWCLFIFVGVPWLIAQHSEHLAIIIPFFKAWQGPIAASSLAVMAYLVLCLIHPRGSRYAELLLRARQTTGGRK